VELQHFGEMNHLLLPLFGLPLSADSEQRDDRLFLDHCE
jgi:hypothetical protein